jgi:nicotinamidase-related amidase
MLRIIPKTLVLVDLQFHYLDNEDYNKLLPRVIKKVKRSSEKNIPIIALWYQDGYSRKGIHTSLYSEIPNKEYIIPKFGMNGSSEIMDCVAQHKLYTNFEVLGVNTHECVAATAIGLKSFGFSVTVNDKYCGCACCAKRRYSEKTEKYYELTNKFLINKGITVVNTKVKQNLPNLVQGIKK